MTDLAYNAHISDDKNFQVLKISCTILKIKQKKRTKSQ